MKKYLVELTVQERTELEQLVAKGKVAGYKIRHAQMLLKADEAEDGPAWRDARIAEAFGVHRTTVERLRKRFVEQGLETGARGDRHVEVAARTDVQVFRQIAVKDHLAAAIALAPQVLGRIAPLEQRLDLRRDVIGDPVHGHTAR